MARRLSFDDICGRGEVVASVPLVLAVLCEVCTHVVHTVNRQPEWREEAGRLADRVMGVVSDSLVANSSTCVYALLSILLAYVATAIDKDAVEVVEVGGGGGDGCSVAISLN